MANHGKVERVLTETYAHGPFVGFIRSFSDRDLPIFAKSRVWMQKRARGQERYFSNGSQKQYYAQKV
jgi:hypothetical protein